MSRYTKQYDFCPGESDLEQIRSQIRSDARLELLMELLEAEKGITPAPTPAPAQKPEPKSRGRQLPKAQVKPRLMLSQEHMNKRGGLIYSHLLAMPKGEVPSDNLDLRHVFNQHPFDDEVVREGWNIIHDRSLNAQYPDHDIYWLCTADWLSERVVKAVVEAAFEVEKAAPIATTPVRRVTNEVVLG